MVLLFWVLFGLIFLVAPALGAYWLWSQRRQERAGWAAVQDHPEEYERVPCDPCKGTGFARGLAGPGPERSYLANRCPVCHGEGWLMVKKDPERVRDTPPKANVAASYASGATPESTGEVPQDEWLALETSDAPTAPTAPTAPDEMDDII